MQFKITRTSDKSNKDALAEYQDFKTLPKLLDYIKAEDESAIIHIDGEELELEIYDDYREE